MAKRMLLVTLCLVTLFVMLADVVTPVLAGPNDPPKGIELSYGAARRVWYRVTPWALRQAKK